MVQYGSSLRRARRPGWQNAYLQYDDLKEILAKIESLLHAAEHDDDGIATTADLEQNDSVVGEETRLVDPQPRATSSEETAQQIRRLEEEFSSVLQNEVEKVCLFALARQGQLADAVGALRFEPLTMAAQDDEQHSTNDQISTPEEPSTPPSSWRKMNDLTLNTPVALLPTPQKPQQYHSETLQTQPIFSDHVFLTNSDTLGGPDDTWLHSYAVLGAELIHLIRYISINAMAVRKILKKHDKLHSRTMLSGLLFHRENSIMSPRFTTKSPRIKRTKIVENKNPIPNLLRETRSFDIHIQDLANSDSMDAISASLHAALLQAVSNNTEITLDHPALLRLECILSSLYVLRECADVLNKPFQEFLSRKAMILEEVETGALEFLLEFQPDWILQMDQTALLEWREQSRDRTAKYPKLSPRGFSPRTHQRRFSFASEHELLLEGGGEALEGSLGFGGISRAGMVVNLMSTLLYTVNYYIVAPTANNYAILLGTDGAYGATLVGASSLAAIFAAFLYSFWFQVGSFRSALLFSAVCPCIGNLMYSYAISRKSMTIAMTGRLLVGLGSAEVVNRQVISTCVAFQLMTKTCAYFVAAGALGMSIGPFLAAVLDSVAGRDVDVDLNLPLLGGVIYNHVTSPGFLMAILWFLEILGVVFLFQEPVQINAEASADGPALSSKTQEKSSVLARTWSDLQRIAGLIFGNPALPITLLLFAYIECLDEVLISSCSMVCRRYFRWHSSTAGFIIASLGALVLPAHFVVERTSRFLDERAIMKFSILFIIISLVTILNFEGLIASVLGLGEAAWEDAVQLTNATKAANTHVSRMLHKHKALPYNWGAGVFFYLVSLAAAFMGTIVLEGVDTSLMSRVTPAELNQTFLNCGLLATLVGTLGRVVGDGTITISALIDKNLFTDFVNDTFFPMIPLALLGYYLVRRFYPRLL